mmetsp:Transcript_1120/g.2359  ORF Transcript_1120/g.2359 Transcript_1120/m.2359 type:complete len:90 (+) Transcript_1120:1327-1596(+)
MVFTRVMLQKDHGTLRYFGTKFDIFFSVTLTPWFSLELCCKKTLEPFDEIRSTSFHKDLTQGRQLSWREQTGNILQGRWLAQFHPSSNA